jgi:hypothetical protein
MVDQTHLPKDHGAGFRSSEYPNTQRRRTSRGELAEAAPRQTPVISLEEAAAAVFPVFRNSG